LTTLYRAAAVDNPHTGFLSHWVHTEDAARWFQGWLDHESPFVAPRRVYRAEVDLTDAWEQPPQTPLESKEVMKRAAGLAAKGLRWLTFYELPYRGSFMVCQYLYLGQEPIPVQPV
jgi:hypothetical protein